MVSKDAPQTDKQNFLRHVRQLEQIVNKRGYDCGNLVLALVRMWSLRQTPLLPCNSLPIDPTLEATNEAQVFVDWLCLQDFLSAAYWVSSAYSILVGAKYQKKLAMYFTPPALTYRLLDDLEQAGVSFTRNFFFDPACGGAAFLAPIAVRMKAALLVEGKTPADILNHMETHLKGADLDVVLCRLSQHFLRMAVAEEMVVVGREPDFEIRQVDSLSELEEFYGKIDVVICNPPYRKMPSTEVTKYRKKYESIITAQPNIYGLFMMLGLKLLNKTGTAAFVTPTSFMSGQYFSKLRTYLMENANIVNIGMVSDREKVFIQVEQETAVTLLRRRTSVHVAEVSANVSVIARDGKSNSVGRCIIPNSGSAWPIPRAAGDVEFIQIMGTSRYRLVDYGYVPRSGSFVWNRDTRPTFSTQAEAKAAKSIAVVPLLWSSNIDQEGNVNFAKNSKGHDPAFVDILNKDSASIVRRPSVLLQRVTSNDQPRRLVAGVVPKYLFESFGGFIGENHVVVLESISPSPSVEPEKLVALLGSHSIDRYFRCISGATNVSIFELSQLPLPDPILFCEALAAGLSADEAVMQAFQEIR